MPTPTLIDTIRYLKTGAPPATPDTARLHLENLLYMSSQLYMTDKKNEKHHKRIHEIVTAMEEQFKNEIHKEINEEGHYEGDVYLVAQILAINKIIDKGIGKVKAILENKAMMATPSVSATGVGKGSTALAAPVVPMETQSNPKLRETLIFLLSVVGDPYKMNKEIPAHLTNLKKVSQLLGKKQQDPKMTKLKASIIGVLTKIYDNHSTDELLLQLNNSIKVLEHIAQYHAFVADFEKAVKNYITATNLSPEVAHLQEQSEKFYKAFKEERNLMKKINLATNVISQPAYKYNKELTAACFKFLHDLESLGLLLY